MQRKQDETIAPAGMVIPGIGEGVVGDGSALALLNDPSAELDIQDVRKNAWRIVGDRVTAEIVGAIGGIRTDELIYNYPKRTNRGGRSHWRACEVMKGGCPYDGQPHVHIVDVGVKGAMAAMAAYGSITIRMPEPPELIDVGSEAMWRVKVTATDKRQGNEFDYWQFEPAMTKYGNSVVFNEHGPHICQSKARRNVVLQLLPGHLRTMWIQDYLNGKEPFSPERVLNMPPPASQLPEHTSGKGKLPPQAPPKQPPKAKGEKKPGAKKKPTSGTGFDDMVANIADTLGLEADQVKEFAATFETPAKATVTFAQAIGDEEKLEDLNEKITIWIEQVTSSDEDEEDEKEEEGEKEKLPDGEEIPMEPANEEEPMKDEEQAQDDLPL